MKSGRKPMVRALLPAVVLALAAGAIGEDFGTALAQETKAQPVAMQRPGIPVAGPEGDSGQAAVASGPVRPPAAATYAVWWIVMNNPGFCGGVCGLDDLPAADLGASLFHAAGFGPERTAPAQPRTRQAVEEAPSEEGDEICQPAECTELQRVTFLPFD